MRYKKSLSVFGLGYVGTVTGACLAVEGHRVIGVDINKEKVKLINNGISPVVERGLDGLVAAAVKNKRFLATLSAGDAVLNSEVSIICVGTSSTQNGRIYLRHIKHVSREIGSSLKKINRYHVIIVRSTVLPGVTEHIIIPALEKASSKKAFRDFGVLVNPEFMREGNSVQDFYKPAKIIIGSSHNKDEHILRSIYHFIDAPLISTDFRTAEFAKYLDNIFHALKICFANEMAVLSDIFGVDAKKAMEIFCMDRKSNISDRYLRPGFAFGGSCLSKDLRAVLYEIRKDFMRLPLVESIPRSNDLCIERVFKKILQTGKKNIGMLGLSFKSGTDDLRDSQMVRLAELLIGKGLKLKIYDKKVALSRLMGANKLYIEKELPHISSLLCRSLDEVLESSDVILVGHNSRTLRRVAEKLKRGQLLIDLRN